MAKPVPIDPTELDPKYRVEDACALESHDVLECLGTSAHGLTDAEAAERRVPHQEPAVLIEEADRGPIEAIQATGASTFQVHAIGILPQVMPVLIGTTVYRWDINVRESSVLGFVGAGGIGLYLYASINQFAWQQVLVVLIAILVIVIASEALSAYVRERIS